MKRRRALRSGPFRNPRRATRVPDGYGPTKRVSAGKELLSLAIPILASNILALLDGSINAMWVGRFLGDTALAAVANVNTVLVFVFAVALGIWTALTVQVGFYFGTGDSEDTSLHFTAACAVFTIMGVSVAVFGQVFSDPLLKALDVPPESFPQATQYLRWISLSVPISYLYGMIIAVMRGAGDTTTTFWSSVLAIALDAGLNPIFIFGLGPIPRLGVRGAALATVLSQGAGLAALVLFIVLRGASLGLPRDLFSMRRVEWRTAAQLLRRGGPMGVEFMGESLLGIMIISLVNRYGPDTTAAFGAASQLWNCIAMPSTAVSLAATSMAANGLGASDWHRVRTITRLGVTFSVLSAGALLAIIEGFNTQAFLLYLPPQSPALHIAGEINRIAGWSCVAFAGSGALMGTPRAAGAVWGPCIVSAFTIVVRFVLAEELLRHWDARGIWWSFPVSGIIALVGAVLYYHRGAWKSARPPGVYLFVAPPKGKDLLRERDE